MSGSQSAMTSVAQAAASAEAIATAASQVFCRIVFEIHPNYTKLFNLISS